MVANMLNGASNMRFKMNGNVYPLIFILHGLDLCKPYMNLMMKKAYTLQRCKKVQERI
jgi:hypothetical protein